MGDILNGVLLIDKPFGLTSHDVVVLARRKLGISQIGHAGTLDPMATGLLVLLVGNATRGQAGFQQFAKVYAGSALFGIETDTWDAQGKIVSQSPVRISQEKIMEAVSFFTGEISQDIPPYSAMKYKGIRLHNRARQGTLPLELLKKTVTIYNWSGLKWQSPELYFTVNCSSGTYIRSIAFMLGRKLACGAHLNSLRRLSVGQYSVESALDGKLISSMDRQSLVEKIIV
ncbi:MAG: tRNA pseudouridine(55) synthase TruB [Elusimicrobia bacterium]|nr:tRNA pseudouridine(55) synthase TruB [Elusimicrobiota bacterium]